MLEPCVRMCNPAEIYVRVYLDLEINEFSLVVRNFILVKRRKYWFWPGGWGGESSLSAKISPRMCAFAYATVRLISTHLLVGVPDTFAWLFIGTRVLASGKYVAALPAGMS